MTYEQIAAMLNSEEYDFLRTDPRLKDRLMFLTLGGSYAYGTNIETSDVDIRGCALQSSRDILGLSNFEQVLDSKTDTTIYGFNKLISLLVQCNPNVIEMLGGRPQSYFYISDIGRQMLDNKDMFLSQRASQAFGGYARQQLRKLQNALARDRVEQARKEEHMRDSMESALDTFVSKHPLFESGSVKLFTDISTQDNLDKEVFCNIHLDKFPARNFNSMINVLSNVLDDYDKLNHRNRKKDDNQLNKHAMHLIRLYLMCFDILERGEINTYRTNDRNMLLEIRNGKYMRPDGTYDESFFELVKEFEKRLEYAKNNTSLPTHPDMKRVESFVMDVNWQAIN